VTESGRNIQTKEKLKGGSMRPKTLSPPKGESEGTRIIKTPKVLEKKGGLLLSCTYGDSSVSEVLSGKTTWRRLWITQGIPAGREKK